MGGANGYGPLAVGWGRPQERYELQCEIIGNHWKMKGSARVLASFLSHALPSANGFPDPQTVSLNPSKSLENKAKSMIPEVQIVAIPGALVRSATGSARHRLGSGFGIFFLRAKQFINTLYGSTKV